MGFESNYLKAFVGLVAILAGVVLHSPHLLFRLPNGFILYAILGGNIPPYFDLDIFNESTDWLKPNDVFVSTAAKSGTTWMLFCSHQIRVKGDDETHPFVDVSISTPWPELIQAPGETWEDRLLKFNTTILPDGTALKDHWDHPKYDFRIFKSHYTPNEFKGLIGGDSKIKFLAMARNGLDQVASMTPFFDKHTEDFRKMWGGFPPADGGSGDNAAEVASLRLKQFMPGDIFGHFYFDYVNNWYKVKDEKNVLLMHYSDAKKDLPGTVSKMADFYGVNLTEKEKKKIVEKCSFDYMKKNTHMFNYRLPLNPNFKSTIMESGAMTRKGINGDGKAMFTEEEKAAWAKLEEEQFGDDPVKLKWARSGGL